MANKFVNVGTIGTIQIGNGGIPFWYSRIAMAIIYALED